MPLRRAKEMPKKRTFDLIPISPEMKGFAGAYCKGLLLMPLFLFFNTFLYYIQVGEGYESICVASSVARLVVNITLDIVLCRIWGTFGIGVATMLGYLSAVLVKLIPVIRRRLSLHFRFFFSMKILIKTISNGFLLSADVICPVLFAMIMNFTMLTVYGDDTLIVFSVILNIARCFMALYFCLSNSIQAIVCQYHGERNFVNIRRTMNFMQKYLLLISGILIGLILVFSGLIPGTFGITNADRYKDTVFAIRCFAPFVVCLGLDALFARYYVCIRHRALGFFLILFSSTIFPVAFQFLFGRIFGIKGIWAGLGAGYVAALILLPLLLIGIRKKSTRRLSAILLNDVETEGRQLSYDIKSTKEEVMSCVHDIDKILKERKEPDSRKRNRLVQMAEENGMNLVDRYQSDPVNIEVSVICPEGSPEECTLVIRTNGILSDVTDEDLRLTSFREYYLSSMMPVMEERSFIKKKAETTMIFR